MLQRRSAKKYTESLSAGRKLGNHMPRIASGDGNEDFDAEARKEEPKALPKIPSLDRSRFGTESLEERQRADARRAAEEKLNSAVNGNARKPSTPNWESRKMPPPPMSPISTEIDSRRILHAPHSSSGTSQEMAFPSVSSGEYLAGTDRLKLSRNSSAPPTPLRTAGRPMSGLWADVQRHLIQAYEYLCHVGEAQQWIEGCLGEELGFGVVEMDEGLRNGVVLARLAQVWDRATVRKIFDVGDCFLFMVLSNELQDPRLKLGWRHTDNINQFLAFVRKVGLPEVCHSPLLCIQY
jgi:Ras GTPase-activating-like protein IQGAP2/3